MSAGIMSAPGPLAGMSHRTMANMNGVIVPQPVEHPTKSRGICLKRRSDGWGKALHWITEVTQPISTMYHPN